MRNLNQILKVVVAAGAAFAFNAPAFAFLSSATGTVTEGQAQTMASSTFCANNPGTRSKYPAFTSATCGSAEENYGEVEYDQDAEDYGVYADPETATICGEVNTGNLWYDDTCIETAVSAFTEDGELTAGHWKFHRKRINDNVWEWIEKLGHKKARRLARIDLYCANNGGATSNIVQYVNSKSKLCGTSFCANSFSSLPNCQADCQNQADALCGAGSCDAPDSSFTCADYEAASYSGETYCTTYRGCTAGTEEAAACGLIADAFYLDAAFSCGRM